MKVWGFQRVIYHPKANKTYTLTKLGYSQRQIHTQSDWTEHHASLTAWSGKRSPFIKEVICLHALHQQILLLELLNF